MPVRKPEEESGKEWEIEGRKEGEGVSGRYSGEEKERVECSD